MLDTNANGQPRGDEPGATRTNGAEIRSWPQLIASHNRIRAADRRRIEALQAELSEAWRQNRRLKAFLKMRDEEIVSLMEALDWDEHIEALKAEVKADEKPPF